MIDDDDDDSRLNAYEMAEEMAYRNGLGDYGRDDVGFINSLDSILTGVPVPVAAKLPCPSDDRERDSRLNAYEMAEEIAYRDGLSFYGRDDEGFINYLNSIPTGDPVTGKLPSFRQVSVELIKELLESPAYRELFQLKAFTYQPYGQMGVVELSLVEDVNTKIKSLPANERYSRGWQPRTDEAIQLGKELCTMCHIPEELSTGAHGFPFKVKVVEDLNDLIICDDGESTVRLLGFKLIFG